MQDAKTFWDKAAAKYAKSPIADMQSYQFTLDRTRTYLKPTDHVLEVGCGTGSTAILLAPDVAQITATDISEEMIKIGQQKATEQGLTNVTFAVDDMLDDAQAVEKYDAILAHNVLHLIDDLPTTLAHIHARLKPNGVFISKSVCAFGKNAPMKFRLIKVILPIMQLFGKAPFVAFRSIQAHENFITAAGFKIVETGSYPKAPPSRYVVAIKQ